MPPETQEALSPDEIAADIDLDLEDADKDKVSEDDEQAGASEDASEQETAGEDGAAKDEKPAGTEEEPEREDSARVQSRINKLTFEREEARRFATAHRAQLEGLTERYHDMANRLAEIETAGDEANDEKLSERVDTLKSQLKTAIEEGNTDAQVDLNDQLLDARVTQREADRRRQYLENRKKQPAAPTQQPEQPLATNWKIQNSNWFGQKGHEDKTKKALEIDKQVELDGFNMRSQAYYDEVDLRLKKAFPGEAHDNTKPTHSDGSPVIPAKRGGNTKSGLKMTASEIRVGQQLGLHNDPKAWAAYKREVAKNRQAQKK